MATLAVGEVYRVRVICVQGPQMSVNVRHYVVNVVAGTSSTDLAMANYFGGQWGPMYKPMMGTTATFNGVGVQRVHPLPVLIEQISTTQAGPGTALEAGLPPQTAGLVRFRTTIAGRKGRGFIYIPFPTENHNEQSGVTTVAYRTLMGSLANSMILIHTIGTAPNTADVTPVLFNRATATNIPLATYNVRVYWSQQRRRSYLRPGDVPPF